MHHIFHNLLCIKVEIVTSVLSRAGQLCDASPCNTCFPLWVFSKLKTIGDSSCSSLGSETFHVKNRCKIKEKETSTCIFFLCLMSVSRGIMRNEHKTFFYLISLNIRIVQQRNNKKVIVCIVENKKNTCNA